MTFDLLLQAYLLLLELVGLAAGVAFAVAGVCASAVAAPNGRGGGDACDVPGACRALFAARSLSCLAAASAAAPAYITPAVLLALLGSRANAFIPLAGQPLAAASTSAAATFLASVGRVLEDAMSALPFST